MAGWVVRKSDFNENPVVSLDFNLDFDLGFVNFLIYNGGVRYMFLSISRAQKSIQDWN